MEGKLEIPVEVSVLGAFYAEIARCYRGMIKLSLLI